MVVVTSNGSTLVNFQHTLNWPPSALLKIKKCWWAFQPPYFLFTAIQQILPLPAIMACLDTLRTETHGPLGGVVHKEV